MTSIEDLEKVEDPFELFTLSSKAIEWHQQQIDRLAEIRARAVATLYLEGTSYKELAEKLGLSTPRVGQLVKSNDAHAMDFLRAYAVFENRMADVAGTAGSYPKTPYRTSPVSRGKKVLASASNFDRGLLYDIEELRVKRNQIAHGAIDMTAEEAADSINKIEYLTAVLTVFLHEQAQAIRPVSREDR